MKVKELISILERCNPDASVITAIQPSWPFECALDGVISREDDELAQAQQILASGCRVSMMTWLIENASSDEAVREREIDELNNFSTEQIKNIFADAIRDEVKHEKEIVSSDSWSNKGKSDDVILLVGAQLRYAGKNLWDKDRL